MPLGPRAILGLRGFFTRRHYNGFGAGSRRCRLGREQSWLTGRGLPGAVSHFPVEGAWRRAPGPKLLTQLIPGRTW